MNLFTHMWWVSPQIILLITLALVMLFAHGRSAYIVAYRITQCGFAAALAAFVFLYPYHGLTFGGHVVADFLGEFICGLILFIGMLVCAISLRRVNELKLPAAEFYVLVIASVLGMIVLVTAHNLLVLYLGLELMSLPGYALVALKRDDSRCVEAGMKYFVMGALASGILLYGISLIFGGCGSINFSEIAYTIQHLPAHQSTLLAVGVLFILAGVVFKLGAAPFHMWVPDVYDGAPLPVTLLISTLPKLATFVMAYRLFVEVIPLGWRVPGLGSHFVWQDGLMMISIASMFIGNLVAVAQKNIRRVFAYSSIAHMGYLLLGFVAGTTLGFDAALFYSVSYALMSLASIGVLVHLEKGDEEIRDVDQLRGLSQREPLLAGVLLLLLFSMAGIPPLLGFMAKLAVLQALVSAGLTWLAVLAVVLAVIGSFYYIRIIKVMYFETSDVDVSDTGMSGLQAAGMPATNAQGQDPFAQMQADIEAKEDADSKTVLNPAMQVQPFSSKKIRIINLRGKIILALCGALVLLLGLLPGLLFNLSSLVIR